MSLMESICPSQERLVVIALRRLDEPEAVLSVGRKPDSPYKPAVLRKTPKGYRQTGEVNKEVALLLVSNNWVEFWCRNEWIATFRITEAGKELLKRALEVRAKAKRARKQEGDANGISG